VTLAPVEDAEDVAARELGRRMSRLTTVVTLVCVLGGFAASVAIFLALVAAQWRWRGEAEVKLTVATSALVGVGGSVLIARWVRSALLRLRAPAWIDELAGYHRVTRERLEEIASLWP
jgi:hypothetical protein